MKLNISRSSSNQLDGSTLTVGTEHSMHTVVSLHSSHNSSKPAFSLNSKGRRLSFDTTEGTVDELLDKVNELQHKVDTTRREDMIPVARQAHQVNIDLLKHISNTQKALHSTSTIHTLTSMLPKFSRQSSEDFSESPATTPQNQRSEVKVLKQQLKTLNSALETVKVLTNQSEIESSDIELREKLLGNITAAYNHKTGKVEWKETKLSSICSVYNPLTHKVETRTEADCCIFGVFNHFKERIEWKTSRRGGVYGVYNPKILTVEWKKVPSHGVCGVFNPIKQEVEWNSAYMSGVVGYFDCEKKQVVWMTKDKNGLALVIKNKTELLKNEVENRVRDKKYVKEPFICVTCTVKFLFENEVGGEYGVV